MNETSKPMTSQPRYKHMLTSQYQSVPGAQYTMFVPVPPAKEPTPVIGRGMTGTLMYADDIAWFSTDAVKLIIFKVNFPRYKFKHAKTKRPRMYFVRLSKKA